MLGAAGWQSARSHAAGCRKGEADGHWWKQSAAVWMKTVGEKQNQIHPTWTHTLHTAAARIA